VKKIYTCIERSTTQLQTNTLIHSPYVFIRFTVVQLQSFFQLLIRCFRDYCEFLSLHTVHVVRNVSLQDPFCIRCKRNAPLMYCCRHETVSGYYRTSAYFLAKLFCDVMPQRVFPIVLFAIITYFMIGTVCSALLKFTHVMQLIVQWND